MDENFKNCTYISENYAVLDVKDSRSLSKLIEKFDQGHMSISFIENGQFKGLLDIISFREGLSRNYFTVYPTAFLEYNDNEEINKKQALDFFAKTRFREVPLLKDGKIMAAAINSATIGAVHKFNDVEFPPIYWDLISDDIAQKIFANKKILISSNYGNLSGFKERFKHLADIDIYNDVNWSKYLNHYYDLFLYGSYAYIGGGV